MSRRVGHDAPDSATVLVVHADADETHVRRTLVDWLRSHGLDVYFSGDLVAGQDREEEFRRRLAPGGPVVVCGTPRAAGSKTVRRYVTMARDAGAQIFGVLMEHDTAIDSLDPEGDTAWYATNNDINELMAALCRCRPVGGAGGDGHGGRFPPGIVAPASSLHDVQSSDREAQLFARRVADACKERHPRAAVRPERGDGSPDFLDVTWCDERGDWMTWPVGLAPHGLRGELVDRFVETVHSRYAGRNPRFESHIVFDGGPAGAEPADEELIAGAWDRGVRVWSVVEYEWLWDPRRYLEHQTGLLAADARYVARSYMPQWYRQLEFPAAVPQPDLLGAAMGWLRAETACLVHVTGDFGCGKSFLLRQLARRIPAELPHLVPILVELGDFDRVNNLDVLLIQHLLDAGEERIEPWAVRTMLSRGRIALLFDGFDELALRITDYEALARLETILSAAAGRAKVVLTSRVQQFRQDGMWRTALAALVSRHSQSRQARIVDVEAGRNPGSPGRPGYGEPLRGGVERGAGARTGARADHIAPAAADGGGGDGDEASGTVKIFLSHRGSDTRSAERLAAELQQVGHQVWFDTWQIQVGDSVVKKIDAGLASADFLVLCLSAEDGAEDGLHAGWMTEEWASTRMRQLAGDDVKILPAILPGGRLPTVLTHLKPADLAADWDAGIGALLAAITYHRGVR